jgi:outer membrane protein OmpA-like peptidoglycan-associated protein
VEIEMSAHTDSHGSDQYNITLSDNRAKSVMQYILSKGISPSRIVSKGYGETKPVAGNENADGTDNPEGRQLNRRVEYEIIGTENTPIVIRMTPIRENLKYRQ